MPTGQSVAVRLERVKNGRCPIHGTGMGQVSTWRIGKDGRQYCYVECCRTNCVKARRYGFDEPIELLRKWAKLLVDKDNPTTL